MGHTYASLYYHLVFSTKHREPLLDPTLQPRVYDYLGGILRGLGGELASIGGVADHVHLLVRLKPTHCLSEVLRHLKGGSSKWLNEELGGARFAWQTGYAAFSVSRSGLGAVARYLARQEEHHRRQTFPDELRELLAEHRIGFEERDLWD